MEMGLARGLWGNYLWLTPNLSRDPSLLPQLGMTLPFVWLTPPDWLHDPTAQGMGLLGMLGLGG